VAIIVAIAHGFTDLYQAVLLPLLPRIMERLDLSIGLAAAASMALALGASLAQPAMGYVADRWGRRVFVVVGPLMSGVFGSMVGWAPGLTVLIVLLVLSGLGSAAFHPPAASMAARVEAGRGSGFRYSLFSLGGTVGFALGPLMAIGIVQVWGLEFLWVAMVPVIIACAVFWALLPADPPQVRHSKLPSPIQLLRLLRGPLGLVFGVSAAAAFVQRTYLTMEPIIAAEAGASETLGAVSISVYLGAQAVGTVTGGILTDRVDRRRLLGMLTAAAVPTHLLALWLPVGSIGALTFAALSGFLNMAILPPVVVMAQEMVPEGTASSSGIVMGLAWATGSILMLGTGFLGDVIGAQSAALLAVPALLVGTLLTFHPGLKAFSRPASAV
jgi:MFS transporter, FSR family, fosmidomycin resistance protein